ncbi:hypothetical protein IWW52_006359, partial [Coemansia sp. RSA 2704]
PTRTLPAALPRACTRALPRARTRSGRGQVRSQLPEPRSARLAGTLTSGCSIRPRSPPHQRLARSRRSAPSC